MNSIRWIPAFLVVALVSACQASSHPTTPAALGQATPAAKLLALIDEPGPISVETVASADWEIDREGLINLEHPKAVAAQLKAGPEPIHIYFHALHHATRGLFIVDTGVEHNYRDGFEHTPLSWLVKQALDESKLHVRLALGEYLSQQNTPLRGVFLTHLHLDHIMGLPDVNNAVPIYVGPNETTESDWKHLLTRSSGDAHLEGKAALRVLNFAIEPNAPLRAVLDLFGDGSLFAIWVPGHTAGSIAYLARTPTGPVLMTGDVSHTRWGWDHQVEPGSFSVDQEASVESLRQLKQLVALHPNISVRLGHQD